MFLWVLHTLYCLESALDSYEELTRNMVRKGQLSCSAVDKFETVGSVGSALHSLVEKANAAFGGVLLFEIMLMLLEATCSVYFGTILMEAASHKEKVPIGGVGYITYVL